jgi:hypothetical protein
MPALRPFTLPELYALVTLSARIRRDVDAALADALDRVAAGDDSALAAVHDRLNVLGRFPEADRIRRLAGRE